MKEFSHALAALRSQQTAIRGLKKFAIARRKHWITADVPSMVKKENALIRKYEAMLIEFSRAITILSR